MRHLEVTVLKVIDMIQVLLKLNTWVTVK